MVMTPTPVFEQTPKNYAAMITPAMGSVLIPICTAGANGTNVYHINVNSTDSSSARDLQFYVSMAQDVAASQTLTSNGTNVSNGDTVTIGSKVYTFQTSLTNVDGNVKIGASAAASLTNLFNAINNAFGFGTPGTDFATAMTTNTQVVASNPTSTTLYVKAITAGTAGNSIATTETAATLTWGASTLTGGATSVSVDYPLCTISCPLNSGNTNAISLLTILDNTRFGTQLVDANGNKCLYLASGSTLKVKSLTTVTAAKAIYFFVQAGDF
jgi:hypothetical protein